MNPKIIKFLNKCNIIFENEKELDGMEIPRSLLLSNERYLAVKNDIPSIKEIGFSSSSLTCLQKNAEKKQKWPLLNLVRQIMRVNNFHMKPIRRANGSDSLGKKKYKRFFNIKKNKQINHELQKPILG